MKRKLSVLVFLLMIVLIGCAGNQANLTPDETARVAIASIQRQLDTTFDSAKLYVELKPQYQEKWKKEIIPAFDAANKTLKIVIDMNQIQAMTAEEVRDYVKEQMNLVLILLNEIGWEG